MWKSNKESKESSPVPSSDSDENKLEGNLLQFWENLGNGEMNVKVQDACNEEESRDCNRYNNKPFIEY